MSDTAKLSLGGKDFEYPVMAGSVGPDVLDIRKRYGQRDAFSYDPGFTSTGSWQSKLTYIDGHQGVLVSGGLPNAKRRAHSTFM